MGAHRYEGYEPEGLYGGSLRMVAISDMRIL